MKYNLILCHLNLNEKEEALNFLQQIKIDLDQPFYSDFVNFKKWIKKESEQFKKEEVFPSRNKLSNFLPKITVNHEGSQQLLKLCVPFPKV